MIIELKLQRNGEKKIKEGGMTEIKGSQRMMLHSQYNLYE